MKKKFGLLILMCICTSIFTGCTSIPKVSEEVKYNYDEVKDILIRFHVIANSDTEADQNLKLKVRDKVIEYMYPLLKDSTSLDESRKIILDNKDKVNSIAQNVIKENGYAYESIAELSHENFPEKSYGNITLPQGNYEAFRIVIGSGSGRNWWCVMFPPLCFIDVTKGKVEEEGSKEELDEQIERAKEVEIEENKQIDTEKKEEEPKIKFKIVEFFKDIFG
ncbi:stage II sporulation protein R [Clostridium paraputrificum]|uniref:stage II sporulation protein R n=1 Tax=Clostridium paraputrificum TaxID=29363 RepID=UPI003D3500AC